MVWPGYKVGGKMTINGQRGCHPRIRDRFDLTLECIRRHYLHEPSPLGDTLDRYADFFGLFRDFAGYFEFFLLQDLVTEVPLTVKFNMPFDDFTASPLPATPDAYVAYRKRAIEFIESRNRRIAAHVSARRLMGLPAWAAIRGRKIGRPRGVAGAVDGRALGDRVDHLGHEVAEHRRGLSYRCSKSIVATWNRGAGHHPWRRRSCAVGGKGPLAPTLSVAVGLIARPRSTTAPAQTRPHPRAIGTAHSLQSRQPLAPPLVSRRRCSLALAPGSFEAEAWFAARGDVAVDLASGVALDGVRHRVAAARIGGVQGDPVPRP